MTEPISESTSEPNQPPSPAPSPARGPGLSRRQLLGLGGGLVAVGAAAWIGSRVLPGSLTGVAGAAAMTSDGSFLAAEQVHTVSLTAPADTITAALATYRDSSKKTWVEATVTIDGTSYDRAGIRLKGNSSLKTLLGGQGADTAPEGLPWLVRLDKYVSGQNHHGLREFVIRSNSTTGALNEAVALDLLAATGLASQQAAYIRLSVNDSAEKLRLVIENPGEDWAARVFTGAGILYKADASGDYSYRGTDAAAYDDVFDVEAGDDDLDPLTSFLDFINNTADTDFASQLPDRLEVDAFATYLAFESVIDNFDDIDGPGNNSMLWWSKESTRMTVVAWDHNLAFGAQAGAGGAGGGPGGQDGGMGGFPTGAPSGMPSMPDQGAGGQPGGQPTPGGGMAGFPTGMPSMPSQGTGGRPDGSAGQGGPGGGMQGTSNALVNRFTTLHSTEIDQAKTRLRQQFFTDGAAKESLERWAALLSGSASDLIDATTLASERSTIEKYFS